MTSLHVICGLGPPIKNPGYAYDNNPRFWYQAKAQGVFYATNLQSPLQI